MPNRFSMNLRPRWREDEPTFFEGAQHGISTLLEGLLQREQEDRTFRNNVAMQGGQIISTGPTARDRVSSIGDAIRNRPTWLGGTGGHATGGEVTHATEAVNRRIPEIGITPFNPNSGGVGAMIDRTLSKSRDGVGVTTSPVARPIPGGDGPATGSPRTTRISDVIQPIEIEGPHGMRARIDPTWGARVKGAATRAESDAANEEKIQSLIDAGMEPKEARARVLNNVVRYDETFGPQAKGSMAGLTFEQRVQLEAIRTKRSAMLEQMKTARKFNDPIALARLQREDARLAQQAIQIQNSADVAALGAMKDPAGIGGVLEASTPQGQAAASARQADRNAIIGGIRERSTNVPGAPKKYSTDPRIRRAQELWDNNPTIQKSRPRPQ